MIPLKPPYMVRQLLVCTNVRDPATNRPSCGRNGGIELRERLKAEVKAAGKKGEVMVVGTSCLGFCPKEGCTVGFNPDNTWFVVMPEEEDHLKEKLLL
jgi:predicted metal-binding protein